MPAIVVVIAAIDRLLAGPVTTERVRGPLLIGATVLLLAVAVGPIPGTSDRVRVIARDGAQYTTAEWQRSPMIEALRTQRPDGTLYSNVADALFFVGEVDARDLPEGPALQRAVLDPTALLAWLRNPDIDSDHDPAEDLDPHDVTLELVATYPDGELYRMTRPH